MENKERERWIKKEEMKEREMKERNEREMKLKKKLKIQKKNWIVQTSVDVSHVVTHHSTKSPQWRLTSQFGMGYGAFVMIWTFVEYIIMCGLM